MHCNHFYNIVALQLSESSLPTNSSLMQMLLPAPSYLSHCKYAQQCIAITLNTTLSRCNYQLTQFELLEKVTLCNTQCVLAEKTLENIPHVSMQH